jgi:hypothetical protein
MRTGAAAARTAAAPPAQSRWRAAWTCPPWRAGRTRTRASLRAAGSCWAV